MKKTVYDDKIKRMTEELNRMRRKVRAAEALMEQFQKDKKELCSIIDGQKETLEITSAMLIIAAEQTGKVEFSKERISELIKCGKAKGKLEVTEEAYIISF